MTAIQGRARWRRRDKSRSQWAVMPKPPIGGNGVLTCTVPGRLQEGGTKSKKLQARRVANDSIVGSIRVKLSYFDLE